VLEASSTPQPILPNVVTALLKFPCHGVQGLKVGARHPQLEKEAILNIQLDDNKEKKRKRRRSL
jgi:hypothetical protein